jgi:hypothetical protein
MANLKEIKQVEIFSSGTWNGDTYTADDLDEMVRAFTENRGRFRPYLKLGHNEEQSLIQADGLPAAGWVGNIYRIGEKLFADFVDIPAKIYELIENRAYRKVSCEIYWNVQIDGKEYPYLLSAVALLGADTPAVMNLSDILSMYGLKPEDATDEIKIYSAPENSCNVKRYKTTDINLSTSEVDTMPAEKTENEVKLEKDLAAQAEKSQELEAELAKFKADAEARETELRTLKEEKERLEAKALEAEMKRQETEREAYVSQLVSEKIITPAMKPYVLALIGDHKAEYSIDQTEGEAKKYSKNDLVKEILKLHSAKDVNVEESSSEGKKDEGTTEDKIREKIEEYMKENKCSFTQAYKAVTKQLKPRESTSMDGEDDAEGV